MSTALGKCPGKVSQINASEANTNCNPPAKDDALIMGRYRQWKAERELLNNLNGIQQHSKHSKVSFGEAEGSTSSVSGLTEEGFKVGCTIPFVWLC
ncbi:hypothetical protein IV203_003528 [Nitzschia inconspicua]|uniref:Uncharacterized protein n=1 Tax=Nitzschia inconspicua TaxID=303405 RepID=A0A9K3L2F0_9STRA|nr:hypothetical protein IV203_003528 [Nitzschia inconspicua]